MAKPSWIHGEIQIATEITTTVNLDPATIGGKFFFSEYEVWNCIFNMRGSRCKVACD